MSRSYDKKPNPSPTSALNERVDKCQKTIKLINNMLKDQKEANQKRRIISDDMSISKDDRKKQMEELGKKDSENRNLFNKIMASIKEDEDVLFVGPLSKDQNKDETFLKRHLKDAAIRTVDILSQSYIVFTTKDISKYRRRKMIFSPDSLIPLKTYVCEYSHPGAYTHYAERHAYHRRDRKGHKT